MKKILFFLFFLIPLLSYSEEPLYHLKYSELHYNEGKFYNAKVDVIFYEGLYEDDFVINVFKNGSFFDKAEILGYELLMDDNNQPYIKFVCEEGLYSKEDDYTIIISPFKNNLEATFNTPLTGPFYLTTNNSNIFKKNNVEVFKRMMDAILKGDLFNTNSSHNSVKKATPSVRADFHGTRVGTIAHIPANGVDKNDLFFQCNVSVYGAKGKNVTLIAYVDGPQQGVGLKNPNGHYTTPDGTVAISKTVQALENNEGTQWKQFLLILPFSELGLRNGDHVINVRWFASVDGMFIGNSGFQTIRFTKRNSDITNFRVDGGEATPGYF